MTAGTQLRSRLSAGVLALAAAYLISSAAHAFEFHVLHSFKGSDGSGPMTALVIGADGALCGTTPHGGANNLGTLFRIPHPEQLPTRAVVLRSFAGGARDAAVPGGLTAAPDGTLYGTGKAGGKSEAGVIFAFKADAKPRFSLVFDFARTEFTTPLYKVVLSDGSMLGVVASWQQGYGGVPYRITPDSGGRYHFQAFGNTLPRSFINGPVTGLTLAAPGLFYGASNSIFYELERQSPHSGSWALTAIYDLDATGVSHFYNEQFLLDAEGNIYGVYYGHGGRGGRNGGVFRLNKPAAPDGNWTFSILHSFDNAGAMGGLVADPDGNLFGTTHSHGTGIDTIFKLTRPASPGGTWTHTTLYEFGANNHADGGFPMGQLIRSPSGVFFGTTQIFGANGFGTVFSFRP